MKTIKTLLNLIFIILNIFLAPYVTFKVYHYFKPYVGFDLPNLSYLNVFALAVIISIFRTSVTRTSKLNEIYKSVVPEENRKYETYIVTGSILIIWFFMWLISLILF